MAPMTSRAVAAVLGFAIALAACGGDDAGPGATVRPLLTTTTASTVAPTTAAPVTPVTTGAPATTAAPTTSTTVPASTTTSSTVPAAASLVLRPDGLGDALFGADPDQVVAYVKAVLGAPTADSGWADPFSSFGVCPGTEVRGVTWGDLTLLFSDSSIVLEGRRHFFSYGYGPPFGATVQPAGMRTAEGIGVGSTVGELRYTYPAVQLFDADLYGPYFVLSDELTGFLTGTSDTDAILSFTGGIGCGE